MRSGEPRWYDDACGAAHALELVGERWALLVIRELMFGPRRFGELREGLPGISANVLTQRLQGLERAKILLRQQLPSPANAQVYELTEWGYAIEPVFLTMGRWAARSPSHDASLPLSAASLLLSFRTMFDEKRARDVEITVGLRLPTDTFVARVGDRQVRVARGGVEQADAVIGGQPTAIAALVYGGRSLSELEAEGALAIEGSRKVVKRFVSLFSLPQKVS